MPCVALAGLLLVWCPCARALDPTLDVSQYAHTAWKTRDGFPNSITYAIAQTADGYLWLGTALGLLRFDGVRAVSWKPPAIAFISPLHSCGNPVNFTNRVVILVRYAGETRYSGSIQYVLPLSTCVYRKKFPA